MFNSFMATLHEWGVWGVLVSLFIEGSAFPFVGTFFIVMVGFLMRLSWFDIAWISILGSFVYALGSFIPYYLGYKFGSSVMNRLSPAKRIAFEKATTAFKKYGIWSVAISSPLHLGNVIPLVAGMSKMKLRTYTSLTMLGIAPSTFLFLSIGQFYEGSPKKIVNLIVQYQSYVLVGLAVVTVLYAGWKVYGSRRNKSKGFHNDHLTG